MNIENLKNFKLNVQLYNDYSADFGAETLLILNRDYNHVGESVDISDTLELELLKENLEEILKHVTEAYNSAKGLNI